MIHDSSNDTVYSLVADRAARNPGAIAIESPGRFPLSYAGLHRLVQQMAMMIRSAEISQADRVAVVMPNGPEFAVVLLGVASVSVAVPFNPEYREIEFEEYFSDLGVKLLVTGAGYDGAARTVASRRGMPVMNLPLSVHPGEGRIGKYRNRLFSPTPIAIEVYKPPESSPFDEARFRQVVSSMANADDIAVVMHTTGTTSRSKVVPLSHRNIVCAARNIVDSLELDSVDKCLSMLPQFHIGGLVDLLLAPIASGGSTVCTAGFETERFFTYLRQFQPTWYQAVPTTLFDLLDHARTNDIPPICPPLRFIRSVSSPLPPSLMRDLESQFGVPVIEIYGMTEAGPLIASNPLPPRERKIGSVGVPCGTEVSVLGEDGQFLERGVTGEVVIRGASVFGGYEGGSDVNARAFHEGWFRTGDLGCFDEDGYLILRGRVKELINRGGEKISPLELDTVLMEHPAISQAVVFPVPHHRLGESIAALVVLKTGEDASERSLLEFMRKRVAPHKVPQHIVITEELPKGATGKVKRLGLAEELGLDFSAEYAPPRTETEAALAQLWADILSVPSVGVRDNFFDLGGHSLLGLELVRRVEQLIGGTLPEEVIEELSTVEAMAAILERESAAVPGTIPGATPRSANALPDSAVRAIKTAVASSRAPGYSPGSIFLGSNLDGEHTPLFWCFNRPDREMMNFARHLGPAQPVIGFYSGAALFDDSQPLISATARFYVDHIRDVVRDGPIIIGGHCRGAAVVLDIAIRLREQGVTNIGLMLMEYFDPRCFEYPGEFTLLYGRQSVVKGFKSFNYGGIGWRERFAVVPEVVLINGYHGSFWAKPFIFDFVKAVAKFIERAGGVPAGAARPRRTSAADV